MNVHYYCVHFVTEISNGHIMFIILLEIVYDYVIVSSSERKKNYSSESVRLFNLRQVALLKMSKSSYVNGLLLF